MTTKKDTILILSKWDEAEEKTIQTCNIDVTYDLTRKESLKKLAIDRVNYLAKGSKIEIASVCHNFLSMITNYNVLYIGYTNKDNDYHELNISNITYPSNEYGYKYFDAFCIDEDGEPEGIERTFKIERIDFIKESSTDGFNFN